MYHRYIGDRAFYRRVFGVAVPIIIQNGISNFVSLLDNIMVGQVGTVPMSGVSIVNGLLFVFNLCVFGASSGAGIFTAQFYGSKDDEGIRHTFRFKFLICIVISLVGAAIFLLGGPQLIGLYLTGEGEAATAAGALDHGLKYLAIMLWGFLPFALTNTYSSTLRETGETFIPMLGGIAAVFVNLVLNYILIFGKFGAPELGVEGAAIATVISQVASCAFVLCVLFGKHIEVPITFGGYDLKVIGRVTSIGMSAFLIILFDNVMLISLNMMLQRYGGDNSDMLLTCNTIVQSFELLITMPLGGLTMGTQTILGYNLGARRPEKILRAQRYIFVIAVSFCALMTLAAQTIPHLFAGIFTKEPEYIAMTARLIRIYTLGTVLLGMQYEIVDGFTGMGVVKIALPLSVFRKVVFFACILILPRFLPIEQIFFCEPISDIFPPLVSILVYALTIKRVINRGPQKQTA